MTLATQVIQQVSLYLFLIFFTYFVLDRLTGDQVSAMMAVKFNKRKKVLVRVFAPNIVYYRAGKITEDCIEYREKKNKIRITSHTKDKTLRDYFYDVAGIKCIDYDSNTKRVFNPYLHSLDPGWDPIYFDNLLERALTMPQLQDMWKKLVLVLLIVLILFVIINTYMSVNNGKMLKDLVSRNMTAVIV